MPRPFGWGILLLLVANETIEIFPDELNDSTLRAKQKNEEVPE